MSKSKSYVPAAKANTKTKAKQVESDGESKIESDSVDVQIEEKKVTKKKPSAQASKPAAVAAVPFSDIMQVLVDEFGKVDEDDYGKPSQAIMEAATTALIELYKLSGIDNESFAILMESSSRATRPLPKAIIDDQYQVLIALSKGDMVSKHMFITRSIVWYAHSIIGITSTGQVIDKVTNYGKSNPIKVG